jgi:hypothetical protein
MHLQRMWVDVPNHLSADPPRLEEPSERGAWAARPEWLADGVPCRSVAERPAVARRSALPSACVRA